MKDLSMSGNTSFAGNSENDGMAEKKKFYPKMIINCSQMINHKIIINKNRSNSIY